MQKSPRRLQWGTGIDMRKQVTMQRQKSCWIYCLAESVDIDDIPQIIFHCVAEWNLWMNVNSFIKETVLNSVQRQYSTQHCSVLLSEYVYAFRQQTVTKFIDCWENGAFLIAINLVDVNVPACEMFAVAFGRAFPNVNGIRQLRSTALSANILQIKVIIWKL